MWCTSSSSMSRRSLLSQLNAQPQAVKAVVHGKVCAAAVGVGAGHSRRGQGQLDAGGLEDEVG
jgi:hypothetical protein